jgi:hypothetical protein
MLRHLTSFALCLLLATAPALAQTATADVAKEEALKKRVVEWGTNHNVTVKLKSGEKVKDRIAEISDEHFIREKATLKNTRIEYAQVAEVKTPREFHLSPFVVRMALMAVPVIIIAAVAASRDSQGSRPVVFSTR